MREKFTFKMMIALVVVLLMGGLMPVKAATVNWNINTGGTLNILGSSTDDYVITGTGAVTSNRITIQSGYTGTITLKNVLIRASKDYAAIRVYGAYNGNVMAPVTKVTIILDGYNQLETGAGPNIKGSGVTTTSNAAALQVDMGAQIHIRAIDENDDTSGELVARCYHSSDGGAGIGGPNTYSGSTYIPGSDFGSQGSVTTWGTDTGNTTSATARNLSGGNVLISSGTIYARGGRCGAGIGGGYYALFPGNIVIYGGDVTAYGGDHSAGIGTGCANMSGNNGWYALSSSIIVLPPAKITATTEQSGRPGLAGANNITYVGDLQSPLITVKTIDSEKNADIYADISETTSVVTVFTALGIESTDYDLKSAKFGNTGSTGQLQFRATFAQNITFFTDASSSQPATFGRVYKPVVTTVTTAKTIELPLLDIGMALDATQSTPMEVGYNATNALTNAYMLKVTYSDTKPMTNVTFELQGLSASDFSGLRFFSDAAGTASIPTPTNLSTGTVFYVRVPINTGKSIGIYTDVLRFRGTYDGATTGWIRQVVTQRIVYDDTNTNTYIKVTANPVQFRTNNASTAQSVLSLNINHGALSILYDAADVTARYLISTEANYDAVLAANPLTSWSVLNVPATDGATINTTASFTGKPEGTYYIHWYVTSGVVYAHSKNVEIGRAHV